MKIIFAGKGERAVVCLNEILKTHHTIVSIVTPLNSPDSLSSIAKENGIEIFSPENINSEESQSYFKKCSPDVVVLATFTQIIRGSLLSVPSYGFINLHGGKLPEYRGSSTLNWMILNGEKEVGISIIKVDSGIDTGSILAQERFSVTDQDTINTIVEKSNKLYPKMLRDVIDKISNGTVDEEKQIAGEGCYYHHRNPEDGKIDWKDMSDRNIFDLVRALPSQYPAFFFYESKKFYCLSSELIIEEVRGISGRIVRKTPKGVIIVAKNRAILIKEVQSEGGEISNARNILKTGSTVT